MIRETEFIDDRQLEALFTRLGVSAYISGHQHAYFPGIASDTRHVAMPCLGSGPRALIGTAGRSAQALVLLEVEGGELTSVEAFKAPDFQSLIPRASLPAHVGWGRHVLTRDDRFGLTSPSLRVAEQ